MELDKILFVVTTITMFVNGYCVRKKYMPGVLISMLVAQAQLFVKIGTTGTSKYVQTIVDISSQSWMIAVAYVFFIWVMGYVLGGIF